MTGPAPLLQLTRLSKSFGGLQALNNFDLTVQKSEIVGLIGPNGAGKTTALNLITGSLRPSRGRIALNGFNVTGRAVNKVARLGLARTYQATTLFLDATCIDNLVLASLGSLPYWEMLSVTYSAKRIVVRRELRERAREILKLVGLSEAENTMAGNLPYGHQRRLGVGIALVNRPKLLLLDEPAAGLNMGEAMALGELIRYVKDQLNVGVLFVEHNVRLVMAICDRIAVLNLGSKISEGAPNEVRGDPAVITAYLGAMDGSAS